MAVWHRSNKSKPDVTERGNDDDATIRLDSAEHAWWAERDELKRAWTPPVKNRHRAEEPRSSSTFESEYSTESLFNWATSDTPDDPTIGGAGMPLDPYAVLGLQPGASMDEVTSAHRRLAKQFHPDRQFTATESERIAAEQTMSRINAAYHELRSRLVR